MLKNVSFSHESFPYQSNFPPCLIYMAQEIIWRQFGVRPESQSSHYVASYLVASYFKYSNSQNVKEGDWGLNNK